MPRFPWLLLLAFVLCSRPAAPADQPQEQPPTQYTTTVQGTVPDLTGRWLVVGYVGLQAKEGSVPISLGWNIAQPHGKLNVVPRYGGLPPGAKAAYDAATSQQAPWESTEEQLHELRDGWDTVAPDRPTKDVMGFAAKEPAGDGYRGNYAGATVANSPHIAPIAFKSTFRMYRLGPEPQPSRWRARSTSSRAAGGRSLAERRRAPAGASPDTKKLPGREGPGGFRLTLSSGRTPIIECENTHGPSGHPEE